LIRYELRVRRFADLWKGLLLDLPWIGPRLMAGMRRDTVCAFAGFADAAETQEVCLIHPARHEGTDVRQSAAFALLPGMCCGPANYLCGGARQYRDSDPADRAAFELATSGMDWAAYSRRAPAYTPATADQRAAPSPGDPTNGEGDHFVKS
jgi:hypothetical protein